MQGPCGRRAKATALTPADLKSHHLYPHSLQNTAKELAVQDPEQQEQGYNSDALHKVRVQNCFKNHVANTETTTRAINHNSKTKFYPESSKDKWPIYRKLLHTTSALLLLLTKAPPRTRGYAKLGADVDQLTQPSRRKQEAEVLPAPFPAFSLPCLLGEEGTYVPLVTAALYVCATSGRSWDADSRISLAGSMLPSSLPGREGNR
ncbi:hypothetical protein DV515_00007829 [Chloebia gouldiae]|uniref:Uncharacterized protein n=1 Tax=Chloebia gouldiae TaxID=44316 RepID=A0A3L8SHW1_CHLGU|nr:hypothetical protein DV515_00007829 [Chloebia gouldiae]